MCYISEIPALRIQYLEFVTTGLARSLMMKMSLLFDILRLTYGIIRAKKNLVGAYRSSWYDQNGFFVYFWYIMKID